MYLSLHFLDAEQGKDAVGAWLHLAGPYCWNMSLVLVQHLQEERSAESFAEVNNSDCY